MSALGSPLFLLFATGEALVASFNIKEAGIMENIGFSIIFWREHASYRTARGGAAERGAVRTSRTRVGLRRGWLVAMM